MVVTSAVTTVLTLQKKLQPQNSSPKTYNPKTFNPRTLHLESLPMDLRAFTRVMCTCVMCTDFASEPEPAPKIPPARSWPL